MPFKINKQSNFKQQCLAKTKKARKCNADKVATKAALSLVQNDLTPELVVEWRMITELEAPKRCVRKLSPEHITRAIKSIKTFGFIAPLTVRQNVVVDGHTRLAAAKELGLEKVPCIDVGHLGEASSRMLAISLNRLAEHGEWDFDELKLELSDLDIEGIDLEVSFFSNQELDIILCDVGESEADGSEDMPEPGEQTTSVEGDKWLLGDRHSVLCANSLDEASYEKLLNGSVAHCVLTDAPYNVKIAGNVSGLGKKKHGEFLMASGEMPPDEFFDFLRTSHQHCTNNLREGGVFYSFIDWRSYRVLTTAAEQVGLQHINTAVWYKGSGGMGGFLRSAHEFCCIFCKGGKPRVNNVELGKNGRDRTNMWIYPGANKPGTSSAKALKDHPTPKNLDMCMDAILDVTHKDDIVLDPFLGSGTTLIAAHRTRRRCYAIELDPKYVDVAIRRWQELTGQEAILEKTGQTFSDVTLERRGDLDPDDDDLSE